MKTEGIKIDGFILPGHVSVIIGTGAYLPFLNQFQMPCVVAGFEPSDILQAILMLDTSYGLPSDEGIIWNLSRYQ